NDPAFTLNAQDTDKQWALVKAGFIEAWEKTAGSEAVVVAVVDTGIDATHEDLQTINFVKGFDVFSRKTIEGKVNSDDNGHGTLIAGILGATANNQAGVAGTNWRISLMPIKALDQNGRGDTAKVAEGIVWAVDNGGQIINLSLDGIAFGHDPVLSEAITYAFRKNAIIVSAAGNDSVTETTNLDINPVFPICEDNGLNMVIGVGASDQNDFKTSFSNYGKNCIDVIAPGKRILSTINHDPVTKIYSANSYAYASGTSLATALVAGQAALLKALYPFASNIQIRDRIITTADQVDFLSLNECGNKPCKGLLGSGRINVKRSLETGIFDQGVLDGDVVRVKETGTVYLIAGGKKQLISSFVYNQRFLGSYVRSIPQKQMEAIPEGPYAVPLENTLVKVEKNSTIYMIKNGVKMPILYSVFKQRGLKFSEVAIVSLAELDSWISGSFLTPKEGTIVKNLSSKNLFWAIGGTLRPINRQFIKEKGIANFSQLTLSDKDINGFSKGEKLY
ncbi:MAG: S8 family serine peptidase, partial [Candidatus Doudnabacteria bacterium]|nr:S8 family serine peptidase [Candidatus Doudnabacteria bacterium]